MTGMSLWRRKPVGEADTHAQIHTCAHILYIERYRHPISCQIVMGIKEESGNYLCSKQVLCD